jgi:hypothetical protein
MSQAIIMGIAWTCCLYSAAHGASSPIYTLHIEPQSLDGALQEFSRQTGIQIIFFSYLTDGRHSEGLDGMYTVGAAMEVLLSGSELTYRSINRKTIEIILRAKNNDSGALPRSGATHAKY